MAQKAECKPGSNRVAGRIIGEIPLGDGLPNIQVRRGDRAIIGSNGPIFVAPDKVNRKNGYVAV